MNTTIKTFGALKKSGYTSRSIKDELRENLIAKIKKGETVFEGVWGYEHTVVPELERAILSRHNINLLGLRGQAKTRLARLMVQLLDEWMPIVEGSEINDDPFHPISRYALNLLEEKGDETPIAWVHRSERFAEKLATPDVTVADLMELKAFIHRHLPLPAGKFPGNNPFRGLRGHPGLYAEEFAGYFIRQITRRAGPNGLASLEYRTVICQAQKFPQ